MEDYELILVIYHGEKPAAAALKDLKRREADGDLRIFNAATISKDEGGRAALYEDRDMSAGKGSAFGALVGGLFGLIGGPLGVVVGAAAGAATGGLVAGSMDLGFEDKFLHEIRTALHPDSSLLLLLVEERHAPAAVQVLEGQSGRVVRHVVRSEVIAELNRRSEE